MPCGSFFNELHALSFLCGLYYFFIRCSQPTEPDVFQQRSIKQILILRHIGDTTVQCFKAHIAKFLSADGNAALLRVIIVNQQFCQGTLAGARFTDKSSFLSSLCRKGNIMENFILNHRGLSIRAGLCCLVSERNMVVSNGVIYSMESITRLLKFRRIQHLLQCGDFIVELGHGWQKAKRFQQRHTDTQRKTQHQNQIGQSRPAAEDKPCTHRQGQDDGTRKQAAVNRHPRPCRPIPCQCIVPII